MIDPSTRPTKLSNAALFFLALAPFVIYNYLVFVLNPEHSNAPMPYVLQLIADFFSIIAVSGLWLTILVDLLTPAHQFSEKSERKQFLATQPTVDVLIPVANEPIEIIRKTVTAAIAIRYPHTTFVLDDGKSDAVKQMAEELGVQYVRRTKNTHAKSGNINSGLTFSKADFFAIIDADFVAKKEFIDVLLGYMEEDSLAFVQSPQFFTNTENFVASGTATAQEIFYKYVLPSRNSSESAFCVGTNVLFRRKAVDEIGGIYALDHSEDIWTSLLLHEMGWKSLFVNTRLASGLAPDNGFSYFKQQKRWAEGGFSIFFRKNPVTIAGLSLDQRVQYLYTSMFYFVAISILIYLLLPIIYLFTGLSPLKAYSLFDWLYHYLPFFIIFYSLPAFLGGKVTVAVISTALATFSPYLHALWDAIFDRKHSWITTSSKKRGRNDQVIRFVWPHLLIIGFSLFGVMIGWVGVIDTANTAINSLWAILNSFFLYSFIRHGFSLEEGRENVAVVAPRRQVKHVKASTLPDSELISLHE